MAEMQLELSPKGRIQVQYAVLNILRNGHEDHVEDVLQEARTKAFRFQHKFEGRCSYDTWFYRIATNEALMFRRDRKRENQLTLHLHEEQAESWEERFASNVNERFLAELPSQALNPEERLLAKERRQLLVEAILKLPPKRRAAILQFATRDRKLDPKLTGPTTNREKSCKWHGIRQLRELLEEVL